MPVININMTFDSVPEAIKGLRDLLSAFSSATSVNTLDNDRHTGHIGGASPDEPSVEAPVSTKRGRGRPPKGKATADEVAPPRSPSEPEQSGEASVSTPEPARAEASEQDVQDVIAALTNRFRDHPADREAIRAWRDGLGIVKIMDLKPEHVPAARQLLEDLEEK